MPTALFASSRRHGNTGRLMDRVAQELGIQVVDLAQRRMSTYDYEHRNRHDDFEPLMQEVLSHEQIIFASPVYWYAVAVPMKVFLDRLSDLLDVPELLDQGRRLRGKLGYVLCTSIEDQADRQFLEAWRSTFAYLGMRYGGVLNANCREGYVAAGYEADIEAFVRRVREAQR